MLGAMPCLTSVFLSLLALNTYKGSERNIQHICIKDKESSFSYNNHNNNNNDNNNNNNNNLVTSNALFT